MSRSSAPRSPRPLLRALLALLAYAGLGLFVWLSVQVYLSKRDPENYSAGNFPFAWIIGPPAKALERAARDRMQEGLEALNDTSRPASERIRLYREQLERAEALLVRSLRAQPAQARALAALAAVRWELDPPLTEDARDKHLELIALASRMAPTYPEVQRELGELLLKMGRRDEAAHYMARTVELDPALSPQVIAVMGEYLFSADEMREALPHDPLVLANLERPYAEESRSADYLRLVEPELAPTIDGPHAILLSRYGDACTREGQHERLADRMEALGEMADPDAEAVRLQQIARAMLGLGRPGEAVAQAKRARDLRPDEPRWAEYVGDVARAARDEEVAITAFRDALQLLARRKAAARVRSRLYSKIGQTEEQRGRPHVAYDAYRKALELNPDDRSARARVEAMERAAGFD